ncbi:MAG: hypothetical protein HYZ93_06365 [Candidatus Omnitrophica bacterium]|nr:hypothetical protein [Candidatus Omnitrophota bacterium]
MIGLILWGPGAPSALAQLTPDLLERCRNEIANDPTIPPEVKEIALNEVLPKLEEAADWEHASPEAQAEAQRVERVAMAIHESALPSREGYEKMLTGEGGTLTPEMAAPMAAESSAPTAMGTELSTDYSTSSGTTTETATSGGTTGTVTQETTSPTLDAPKTETSGSSETTFESKYSDGHPLCATEMTHVEGVDGSDPGHCV